MVEENHSIKNQIYYFQEPSYPYLPTSALFILFNLLFINWI